MNYLTTSLLNVIASNYISSEQYTLIMRHMLLKYITSIIIINDGIAKYVSYE